jgi:hypothetical protein
MGRDAVPERLDPCGEGFEAVCDPPGGVRLERRSQRPADGPTDGGADRPMGDESHEGSQEHGAGSGLAVGGVDLLHKGQASCWPSRGPDAADHEGDAHADAGAEQDDDRGHRPYPAVPNPAAP